MSQNFFGENKIKMDPLKKEPVGKTNLSITRLGSGGTTFGNLHAVMSDDDAIDTIHSAYNQGIRYFDTAPLYGNGLSEVRMGKAFKDLRGNDFIVSTKVGYSLKPTSPDKLAFMPGFVDPLPFTPTYEFSRDSILKSLDQSIQRLNIDSIDIVYIHDPDEGVGLFNNRNPYEKSHFVDVMGKVYPALNELRDQGIIKAIGVGMNQWQMLADFATAGDFDIFLLAGCYSLLKQDALEKFLPLCEKKSISVVIGSPYHSGILATGTKEKTYYNGSPATSEVLEKTRHIEAVCKKHRVSLPAAAIQFPFGHPAVKSVLPASRSPKEIKSNIDLFTQKIPVEFWEELKFLSILEKSAPTPY